MKLATIILAAGKGKRMGESDIPKVMHLLAGKPMIDYVIRAAIEANAQKIVIIIGHKRELIIDYVENHFKGFAHLISFAVQEEQLWSGHAVIQAEKALKDFDGNIAILSGDSPLIQPKTITSLLQKHINNNWVASLISAKFQNPFWYGRILRNASGEFYGIKEEKDASDVERKIQEVNSGMYLCNTKELFEALSHVKANNAQKEYYLTDIFEHFSKENKRIGAVPAENSDEILWVNTKEQLEELELKFK